MKELLSIFSSCLALTACSSDPTPDNSPTTSFNGEVSGRAQKGPFAVGTDITAGELDATLAQTGRSFAATIVDDSGFFQVPGVSLQTPFTRLGARGFYFNELAGKVSDAPLSLFTFVDLSQQTTINVNLLGHLEASRIEYLVREQALAFDAAKTQAHNEVLAIFTFDATQVNAAETLDIGAQGDGNAMLLALSVILQGTRSVGELSELLANIQTDIRTDGVLDSATSGSALMNGARTINLATIRSNLEKRFQDLGLNATVPPFETYVQKFVNDAPYAFTGGIKYPTGSTRPNFLDPNVMTFTSNLQFPALGFAADLPPYTELVVKITRTSNGDPSSAWYLGSNGTDWDVTVWNGEGPGPQTFTARHDGHLDLEQFGFGGTGSATIDYYEYGSTTPAFTKQVTWAP